MSYSWQSVKKIIKNNLYVPIAAELWKSEIILILNTFYDKTILTWHDFIAIILQVFPFIK